ncbi:hypothetical protein Q6348_05565 [Isoptericola sp. b441]|uniref:Integral membrane protein n=1 Tax=Actinotalea lenta TaxID=3064654 RepID=A0ABT9DBU2_9CELL|nr:MULTISPECIES: hypothetical protein [unclassified Isoptericola]MDO8106663.1 hypothetical protein [Isoptericola sp. b441]MDO8121629.1 hypothetical protein [Isoptericola sp. b490]
MEFLKHLLLVLHFVGLASLLGGFLVQMKPKAKVVNAAMLHGALTQLVTGVALVGVVGAIDTVNYPKVFTKLVVLLVILGLVYAFRGRDKVSTGVWGAIGGLTLANVVVAVFW